MTRELVFARWAPEGAIWSPWAKPVVFTQLVSAPASAAAAGEPADETAAGIAAAPMALPELQVPASLELRRDTAIVVDLAGEESILLGLALARRGWRPVPLFNATRGPAAIVDVDAIARWLVPGAELLERTALPADAPPAFLLDANRHRPGPVAPGSWDNRWLTFPQDFPSASFLRSRGIERALLVQRGTSEARVDLSHVLLAWQQDGIAMQALDLAASTPPAEIRVREPSYFRLAWYRALALLGLRRSNVGGFGAQVPLATTGTGGSGYRSHGFFG